MRKLETVETNLCSKLISIDRSRILKIVLPIIIFSVNVYLYNISFFEDIYDYLDNSSTVISDILFIVLYFSNYVELMFIGGLIGYILGVPLYLKFENDVILFLSIIFPCLGLIAAWWCEIAFIEHFLVQSLPYFNMLFITLILYMLILNFLNIICIKYTNYVGNKYDL